MYRRNYYTGVKPRISKEVNALIRKRDKTFKKQRRTGRPQDIDNADKTKARLQMAERQSYWNFVDHTIDKGNPK